MHITSIVTSVTRRQFTSPEQFSHQSPEDALKSSYTANIQATVKSTKTPLPRKVPLINHSSSSSPLLKAVLLALVEQVGLCTSEIDDLRTAVAIFLRDRALLAVVRVGHARAAAYHTPALVRAVVALVTDAHQRARPHVRVTDHALTVTFVTKSPDSYTGLFPAKY